jgi:hypothetical protein
MRLTYHWDICSCSVVKVSRRFGEYITSVFNVKKLWKVCLLLRYTDFVLLIFRHWRWRRQTHYFRRQLTFAEINGAMYQTIELFCIYNNCSLNILLLCPCAMCYHRKSILPPFSRWKNKPSKQQQASTCSSFALLVESEDEDIEFFLSDSKSLPDYAA